jgi:hypothetical protein
MAAAETGGEMSTPIERTLNYGIRILHTPTKTTWCIHCNLFVPNEDPYNFEAHEALCPYAAIASLVEDRDEYRKRMHMAETKVMSRDQIIKQLSETELAKDVAGLEEQLADAKDVLKAYPALVEVLRGELADCRQAYLRLEKWASMWSLQLGGASWQALADWQRKRLGTH